MISLIAAVAQNRVIGSHNALPWYIKEDLKHFRDITTGHTVLMGRKTYDSIANRIGKPLPNRKNVVVSRQQEFQPLEGVHKYPSLEAALEALKADGEVMVAGGGQVFAELIGRADKLYITEVHREVDGDVLFPEIDKSKWQETSREDHGEFSFVIYNKIK